MLVRLVRLVQLSVGRNAPSNADRDAGNAGKNALSTAYGDASAWPGNNNNADLTDDAFTGCAGNPVSE